MQLLATISAILSLAGLLHTLVNLQLLRRPSLSTFTEEHISVLIPARNEEQRIGGLLTSLKAQIGVPNLEIIVLDDQSSDGTADIVKAAAHIDPRVNLIHGADSPPHGWLGKQWASHRLAQQARGSVLVFLDADVVLAADALARSVNTLRETALDLISPYPRQIAGTFMERLVQPLIHWSWLTTLPLRLAERSARPSLTAANGQFLVIDAKAYVRSGGFAAVKDQVLDDIHILRRIKASGGRGVVVDGTDLGYCRMYDSTSDLITGYAKSLWTAFGGPVGTLLINAVLVLTYVFPLIAMTSSKTIMIGIAALLCAITGRLLVAQRTGGRLLPDSLLHPLSIMVFAWLNAVSWKRHLQGTTQWKGRAL